MEAAGDEIRERRRLLDLIDEATTSPAKSLDLGLLQSVKALVRTSDANVHTAFDTLFDKLKKNHSQVWIFADPSFCDFAASSKVKETIHALDHPFS